MISLGCNPEFMQPTIEGASYVSHSPIESRTGKSNSSQCGLAALYGLELAGR